MKCKKYIISFKDSKRYTSFASNMEEAVIICQAEQIKNGHQYKHYTIQNVTP